MKLFVHQEYRKSYIQNMPPYSEVFETEPLLFRLKTAVRLESPYLLIGELRLELRLAPSSDKSFLYETDLKNYFVNNVGIAVVELMDESDANYETLGRINILSCKLTTERMSMMLDYICDADSRLLHCCFSSVYMNSSGKKFEYTDLNYKLMITEKTLSFLWENRDKFKNQPCKRIKVLDVVREYEPKLFVDERSYSWLLSHMDELKVSSDPKRTLLRRYGKNLTVRKLASSSITDDKDIFENRVIFSFLISVKKFVNSIEKEENFGYLEPVSNNEFVDIVPFIQSFISEKVHLRTKLVTRICSLVDSCLKFVTNNFTKCYTPNIRPRITQYVSKHNHYMSLYKFMDAWWNIEASCTSTVEPVHQLLFSIDSIDNLYEIFTLLKLLEAFKSEGLDLVTSKKVDFKNFPSLSLVEEIYKKPNEPYNFFALESEEVGVRLFVEPVIYPYREDVVDGELFIVDKEPDDRGPKKLYDAKYMKTPDFVIEVNNKVNTKKCIFILDAKYSDYDTVLFKRLQTKVNHKKNKFIFGLVDKYLHGVRYLKGDSYKLIDGVFAAHISSNSGKKAKVINGISRRYSILGENPISPFVGLVEFAPEKDESLDLVKGLLKYSIASE